MTMAVRILQIADELGISVGTDGDELIMVAPLRVPREIRHAFEQALERHKPAIIDAILREPELLLAFARRCAVKFAVCDGHLWVKCPDDLYGRDALEALLIRYQHDIVQLLDGEAAR